MKKIFYIFIAASLVSCASYVDKTRFTIPQFFTLEPAEDHNTITTLEGLNASADGWRKTFQLFSIQLPKGIEYWSIYSREYVFEYDSKQMIVVWGGYQNYNLRPENWELRDVVGNEFRFTMQEFLDERNYNTDLWDEPKDKRLTKIYTNGEVKILLFNIKPKNFDSFLNNVKQFQYLGELKENTKFDVPVFLDFPTSNYRFCIADKKEKFEPVTIEPRADQVLNDRLVVGNSFLSVSTGSDERVKGDIVVLDKQKEQIDLSHYDHVVEASLPIKSGTLQILNCINGSVALEVNVIPAYYRVRVYFSNLHSVNDDYYKIEIWKDHDTEKKVLKKYGE